VRVSNSVNSVTSGSASLTVNGDSTPPTLVSGLGLVDGAKVLLSFSEPLDTARGLANSAFHVQLTVGGGVLPVASLIYSNATNVIITTATARTPDANYSVRVDANAVYDVNANGTPGTTIPIPVEVELLSFTNSLWTYNADGVDLGIDWIALDYDETGWLQSRSVFDGKEVIRTTVAGFPVNTQLPLNNDDWPRTPTLTNDIPTYYFRTHFNLAATPDQVSSLKLRTLIDDSDLCYFNGGPEAYRRSNYTNNPALFGYERNAGVGTAVVEGPFTISPPVLVSGDNLVAVELHQVNETSSDITFAYELIATVARFADAGPRLSIGPDPGTPGNILITWPAASGAQLYSANAVNAPVGSWTSVASGGSYSFDPRTTGTQKFYTLRR
jgi:hypothetical protein